MAGGRRVWINGIMSDVNSINRVTPAPVPKRERKNRYVKKKNKSKKDKDHNTENKKQQPGHLDEFV